MQNIYSIIKYQSRITMERVILIIFFFITVAGFSQEFDVRISNITDENGIEIPATFGIVEDSFGFLWFATVDGLYRYDGYKMKVFRNSKDNPNSISDNTVRAILVDSAKNCLWLGTQGGGLNVYDLISRKFMHYKHKPNDTTSLSNNSIWTLMMDVNGDIWIGMENKMLNRYSPKENVFYNIPLNKSDNVFKGSCTIRMLFEDNKGKIWAGTDNYGLYSIDRDGNQKHYYDIYNNPNSLQNNFILSACQDVKNDLWISTYGAGVARYRPESDDFIHIQNNRENGTGPISNLTYSIITGLDNELWVGTEYGLSVINTLTGQTKHYVQTFAANGGLSDNRIRKIFKDSKGILWIGTEAGVNKIIQQTNFRTYRNNPKNRNSLPKGIVRVIFKDKKENLWFGFIDKGLVKYNHVTNKFTHYIDKKNIKSDLICYQVSAVFEDSEGILWIGDWEQGLLRFDPKRSIFTQELSAFFGDLKLIDNRIQLIKEESPGILWIGTETGLHRYNYKTKHIDYLLHDENNLNTLSGNAIQSQAFEFDGNGNIWVGTWAEGLNFIEIIERDPFECKVTRYKENEDQQWININNVISLYLQDESTLWIGTFGGGLNRMDIPSGKITNYDTKDGLPNNIIFAISKGVKNSIWLSTDFGLSNFNPDLLEFHNFNAFDGLQDNHFFWGSAFTVSDGELYFGGINGVNSFYPEKITQQKGQNRVLITDIKVNNISVPTVDPIESTKEINLDYDQNFIKLDFTILNYFNSSKFNFIVKLDGLESKWNDLGKQRTVNYSNLAPGSYVFKIKARNTQNYQVTKAQEVKINIAFPWWQKWWAVIIQILIVVFTLYSLHRIRLGVLTKQKNTLTKRVKERTHEIVEKNIILEQKTEEIITQKEELTKSNKELKITLNSLSEAKEKVVQADKMASLGVLAAGVAHEINNPLNFIKSGVWGIESSLKNSEIGKDKDTKMYIKAINEGISRVVAIVSGLNQFSRSGDKQDEKCSLTEIIDNCLIILSNQLKNRITINKNMEHGSVDIIGNSGKLHQAFLNILVNAEQAIPDKGTIQINSKIVSNKLEVTVIDDGVGIVAKDLKRITEPFYTTKDPGKGTGLGLSITYKIIKEHKGKLLFESDYGKGTKVIITLPFQ